MTKKELSQEEQRVLNVKSTLESKLFQTTLGTNLVQTNPFTYGEIGLKGAQEGYRKVTSSEDFQKEREKLLDNKKRLMEQNGVYGEPSVSDADISLYLIQQLREVMSLAKLGELEEQARSAGARLDFEVPAGLREYLPAELFGKAMTPEGKMDLSKLNDEEKDALGMYQILVQAYERACSLKVIDYFSDVNSSGKQIVERYAPATE
ncbi:MAG: hypothetical protein KKF68_00785 [Nanoarchaeota archaeon]|nr:hypothetical protein [Nanoarchaeota archaeon]